MNNGITSTGILSNIVSDSKCQTVMQFSFLGLGWSGFIILSIDFFNGIVRLLDAVSSVVIVTYSAHGIVYCVVA